MTAAKKEAVKQLVPLELISEARNVLKDQNIPISPLLPLQTPASLRLPGRKIYLKCENFLPFNSFKVRGACYALSKISRDKLEHGVCAASAGNFGQGLGYMAKQTGVPCAMIVPDDVPETKLTRMLDVGVTVKKVPFSDWWNALVNRSAELSGLDNSTFVHTCDIDVMAGHGTIGFEIVEQCPNVDYVISPFGSGGLITGLGSVLRKLRPEAKIIACEPETATPLKESFLAGKATHCTNHKTSFVDGMGGKQVLDEMWPYVSHLVDDTRTVTLQQISDAAKLLMESNCMIAEGAGAASVAAALHDEHMTGNIVCIVSGGNIDPRKLCKISQGRIPD